MALSKPTSGGQIPANFSSPFKRVQMQERIDDSLACVATITNQSLETIMAAAIQHGFPKHGPAWVDDPLIARICFQFGLVSSAYKEVESIDALPNVCILMVDYNPKTEVGRHVVWHHVPGTNSEQAFSYVTDVASWIDPKHFVTTDFRHMNMEAPLFYIEIFKRSTDTRSKGGK